MNSQWSQNSWKPKQRAMPFQCFKPKDSWTHIFVCLSKKDHSYVPSQDETGKLEAAGLGEKTIAFSNRNGSLEHVRSTLKNQFPKLKDLQGGLEILRAANARRNLEVIAIALFRYTVPSFWEALGQAIAYVRPVQQFFRHNYHHAGKSITLHSRVQMLG